MPNQDRSPLAAAIVAVALLAALLVTAVSTAAPGGAADGPTLSVGDQSGLERDEVSGSVFVPVTLSEPLAAPLVVSFHTLDGTAVAGTDYTRWGTPAVPRTVTIPAGSLQTTINVPVLPDSSVESDETFSVVVVAATGAPVTIGDDRGTATIVDADGISADNPALTVSSPTIVEGDNGSRVAQFHLHLSRPTAGGGAVVSYSTGDGTAVAGTDYTAKLPGVVVFAPGQISKTIDVAVAPNTGIGADRQFVLEVVIAGGPPVEDIELQGVATIREDDLAPPDTTAPVITVPNAVEANVTTPTARTVTFSASAVDDRDGTVPVFCTPPSGSTFQLGTTTVDCTASDTSGNLATASFPVTVRANAIDVATGANNTCAVVLGGNVWCWGNNLSGQLGPGATINVNATTPRAVTGLTGATTVGVGTQHSCASLSTGSVSCWGQGASGQLGNGAFSTSATPVAVTGISNAVDLAANNLSSCALLATGSVRCWGANDAGQLGNGTRNAAASPVSALGINNAVAITTGALHTCALLTDTTVKCWGHNYAGQIGNGTTTDALSPVTVPGLTGVTSVSAGGAHTCATLTSGALRCWGRNNEGQLGLGTSPFQYTSPVVVPGVTDAVQVEAGDSHTCVRRSDGTLRCSGRNAQGQLGNGTTTNSSTFVPGATIAGLQRISGTYEHACALTDTASLRCWGRNSSGQLGNGTTVASSTPVTVRGF